MIIEITVPELGESIRQVEIGEWLVEVGERVAKDQPMVTIESEKAGVELPAPQEGLVVEIGKRPGETAGIGEIIARIDTAPAAVAAADQPAMPSPPKVMPSAARILAQHDLSADLLTGSGPGGRILKEDALAEVGRISAGPAREEDLPTRPPSQQGGEEASRERRMPMNMLRRTIAARLLEATQSMAMLTTFNEADMTEVKNLRRDLGEAFAEKFGIRLGFMSFFVKAVVSGLLDFPLVNARIDGDDIVYHHYCDIGVAIGGGKGLVVPVIRHAERLSLAELERAIADFGQRAKNNSLSPDELKGGTFTISNGGVYGSMLSTPIINPPQSAILGLHAIKDRPVVLDGEIRIRPVMYLALSYDHRLIDGREAVGFLKSVKERIEQPHKLLLEI